MDASVSLFLGCAALLIAAVMLPLSRSTRAGFFAFELIVAASGMLGSTVTQSSNFIFACLC